MGVTALFTSIGPRAYSAPCVRERVSPAAAPDGGEVRAVRRRGFGGMLAGVRLRLLAFSLHFVLFSSVACSFCSFPSVISSPFFFFFLSLFFLNSMEIEIHLKRK